ncbi:hypothetical protein A9Q86_09570 [Flavobacteriales bacterium 33_180_T64]|nr:hypothetical protein A9Q86_09570 [Flavobacteriales bacterium 33_180_T64]
MAISRQVKHNLDLNGNQAANNPDIIYSVTPEDGKREAHQLDRTYKVQIENLSIKEFKMSKKYTAANGSEFYQDMNIVVGSGERKTLEEVTLKHDADHARNTDVIVSDKVKYWIWDNGTNRPIVNTEIEIKDTCVA